MSDKSDFDNEFLKERFKILLDEDNEIKKWNEGILIKSFILLPIIIFIVGLFIINRPANLNEIIFILLYPLSLVLIGVILLFVMRRNLG